MTSMLQIKYRNIDKRLSYRLENRVSAWHIRLITMLLSGIWPFWVKLYVTWRISSKNTWQWAGASLQA